MKINISLAELTKNPLLKNSAIYIVTDAINKAIPFLLLPILTHYLIPSDFGIATNFNVYTSILTIFIGISINSAISANFYRLKAKLRSVYIFNALATITLIFIISLLVIYILKKYITAFLPIPIQYIVGATVIAYAQAVSSINLTIWQLESKSFRFGIYGISQTVLNVGLTLIFVIHLKMGWRGRVDGYIYSTIIYGVVSMFFIFNYIGFSIKVKKDFIHDALIFSLPLVPHALSMWVRSGIDRIYITKYYGEASTGLYATAFQFGLLISFITLSINNAYVPFLYKQLNLPDNATLIDTKSKLVRYTYIYFAFLITFGICMIVFSMFMVDNFLSQKYYEAKRFIPLIIVSQIFQGMYLMVVNYIFFIKRTGILSIITFSCSLLQVVLSYFMIRNIGVMGAVYSTVIVSFVNFIAVWIYSDTVYPMPWLHSKKGRI
jgi:O-antigen/teichoic acid export membrane protein